MTGYKVIMVVVVLVLLSNVVEPCQRMDSPCGSDQCCFLVFNFRWLSYSFCRNRDKNDKKCAQNDYCLLDSDCSDSGGKCEGASVSSWGRCKGGLNPCLKKAA